MSVVEGYPELNFCANDATEYQDAIKGKEQRSLFALEAQLQKTKLCRYHMKGLCKHATECRFAHGPSELAELPNLQKTRMCPSLLANGQCDNPDSCTFAHHESEIKKVNICHKTAMCTWYLAGKCRNGTECKFAHGEHELKGVTANSKKNVDANNQMPKQQMPKQMLPPTPDNNGNGCKEPMFVHSSIMPPAYCPPESSLLSQPYQVQPPLLQWPAVGPQPGLMPNFMDYMQPCFSAYPPPLMPEMLPDVDFMSMQPSPVMQQYPGVEAATGLPQGFEEAVTSLPPGLGVGTVAAPTPAQLVSRCAPGTPSQKSWQLTELAVQFNMLSEEVRRLQDRIIPRSVQSTNTGSDSGCSSTSHTRSSSGDDRAPQAAVESSNGQVDADGCQSFAEKVAHLQNELKHVMDEGKRCGKFFQTIDL